MKISVVANTMHYLWSRRPFLRALQEAGHQIIAIAPFDGYEEMLQEIGVEVFNITMARWRLNPLAELRTLVQLAARLRSVRPEATILYTPKPIIYGSLAARLVRQRPIYSVITGLGYAFVESRALGGLRRAVLQRFYRLALSWNRKVFFQNATDLETFLAANVVREDQVVRVPGSGVDTGHYLPPDTPAQEATFILISRMLWDKGIRLYVEAADNLRHKYPQAKFLLLGAPDDNPAAVPLETLLDWDNQGIVHYCGFTEDVREQLGSALVFVLPSFYREGIPRTNLEALSMGKAIITTDMPGCRETVKHGVNGFLIPPRDQKALQDAMEIFLRDPSLAREMGKASRELAIERFEMSKVSRLYIETLEAS